MNGLKKALLGLSVVLASGIFTAADAQIVVKLRPARPHYVRSVRPSPRHVWVDEDWRENNGRYEWAGGHWVEPPHPHAVWAAGHWRGTRGGSVWIPGHWR